jgi:hypothetical protein
LGQRIKKQSGAIFFEIARTAKSPPGIFSAASLLESSAAISFFNDLRVANLFCDNSSRQQIYRQQELSGLGKVCGIVRA